MGPVRNVMGACSIQPRSHHGSSWVFAPSSWVHHGSITGLAIRACRVNSSTGTVLGPCWDRDGP
eukprot:6475162-Alexandrium_andersonii.AAC.2